MQTNYKRIVYWIATALMLLIFSFSAGMYLTQYEMVVGFFEHLGFPVWMIYPLAILKLLGIVAILTAAAQWLLEWAYAGFFFDAIAAISAHYMAGDGITSLSMMAFVAIIISRLFLSHRSAKFSN